MTQTKRIILVLGLLAAIALLGMSPLAAQCAMCRTALTESAEGQQLAAGFNSAILFLLSAPYLVFGTLAGSLWMARRRKLTSKPVQHPVDHDPRHRHV